MLDSVAFYESRAGTTTLQNIAGLADPHTRVNGDYVTVPDIAKIIMALVNAQTATSGDINQARLQSPSMMTRTALDLPNFTPTGTGIPENASPTPINDFVYNPRQVVPGEQLEALTANSGTNTEDAVAVVFLSDGQHKPISSELQIETIRNTNASTLVADAWSNGALTIGQNLQAGTYAVVGMRYQSAGAIAARLVFANQGARPACIGYDAASDIEIDYFRHGNLGVWGTFPHTNPPTVDFLSDSADTSQIVFLDVVKVG